jgi:hypothetical protein
MSRRKKNLSRVPDGCLTRRRTGRLTVGRNLTSTSSNTVATRTSHPVIVDETRFLYMYAEDKKQTKKEKAPVFNLWKISYTRTSCTTIRVPRISFGTSLATHQFAVNKISHIKTKCPRGASVIGKSVKPA